MNNYHKQQLYFSVEITIDQVQWMCVFRPYVFLGLLKRHGADAGH